MDISLHRSNFVHVNGIRLHYLDWGGEGPVLLFLTGMGCSAYIFGDFAPRFGDQFHVLAFDRRGHGDSDYPETGYDPDTLTESQKIQVTNFFKTVLQSHQKDYIEQFQRNVPHARVVEIPSGHHYCFIKQQQVVFEEMAKFLQEA